MDILDQIVRSKRIELEKKKLQLSYSELEHSLDSSRSIVSFSQSLLSREPGIIAEFKRRSPSKSDIKINASVPDIIPTYEQHGAAAISVLTNEEYFNGSLNDLNSARKLTKLPLLRKEFIIDEYQILEAYQNGADAILLISEILSKTEIHDLAKFARTLQLEVLLELHSDEQIEKINEYINVVGVNNRNLKNFTTDPQYSIDIYNKLPQDLIKISESGLSDVRDIQRLRDIGYQGFLIGEAFMREEDPGLALQKLINNINVG